MDLSSGTYAGPLDQESKYLSHCFGSNNGWVTFNTPLWFLVTFPISGAATSLQPISQCLWKIRNRQEPLHLSQCQRKRTCPIQHTAPSKLGFLQGDLGQSYLYPPGKWAWESKFGFVAWEAGPTNVGNFPNGRIFKTRGQLRHSKYTPWI